MPENQPTPGKELLAVKEIREQESETSLVPDLASVPDVFGSVAKQRVETEGLKEKRAEWIAKRDRALNDDSLPAATRLHYQVTETAPPKESLLPMRRLSLVRKGNDELLKQKKAEVQGAYLTRPNAVPMIEELRTFLVYLNNEDSNIPLLPSGGSHGGMGYY
ncbi:MAG: hypothetical protein ABII72_02090 [Parcubacteria group bacterium]